MLLGSPTEMEGWLGFFFKLCEFVIDEMVANAFENVASFS
jgi:hypothetical protein